MRKQGREAERKRNRKIYLKRKMNFMKSCLFKRHLKVLTEVNILDTYKLFSAACKRFWARDKIVIGPTPPGTGVIPATLF